MAEAVSVSAGGDEWKGEKDVAGGQNGGYSCVRGSRIRARQRRVKFRTPDSVTATTATTDEGQRVRGKE